MKWHENRNLEANQISAFLNKLNSEGVLPQHIMIDSYGTVHYYANKSIY